MQEYFRQILRVLTSRRPYSCADFRAMNQRQLNWKKSAQSFWVPVVLLLGLGARFWVGTLGHNFDYESFRIVVDITRHGENVYANTTRYNYGPIWFLVLHGFDLLSGGNEKIFRELLIGFLSAADVGIFFILWKKFGRVPAIIFFLNPVSIIITGYHNQFGNLVILTGLWAVLLLGDDFEKPVNSRKLLGLSVLGISLMTKHLLFAFPFWLAVKQKGRWQKLWMVLIPISIFAAGFLPFWREGHAGIIQNVFLYRSSATDFFYDFFMPQSIQLTFNSLTIWFLFLGLFAFVYREKKSVESLLLYTCVLVATSTATANQYLAIPMAFVATHLNVWTILYTVIATFHLVMDHYGLHYNLNFTHSPGNLDAAAVCILFLWLVWDIWRDSILRFLEKCIFEVKNQLNPKK